MTSSDLQWHSTYMIYMHTYMQVKIIQINGNPQIFILLKKKKKEREPVFKLNFRTHMMAHKSVTLVLGKSNPLLW